jgi:hypothetical protein
MLPTKQGICGSGRVGGLAKHNLPTSLPDQSSIYRNGVLLEAGKLAIAPMPTR